MNATVNIPFPTNTILVLRTLLLSFIVTAIIISNILNIIILKQLRELQTIAKTLLINLSVADLLNGFMVCIPGLLASTTDTWLLGEVYCQISGIVHGTSCSVSIWCLSAVSLDRYLAISYPVRYRNSANLRHSLIAIILFWLAGILTFSAPLFNDDNYYKYQKNIVICGMYWESPVFCIVTGLYTPVLSAAILFWTSYKVTKMLKNISKVKTSRRGQAKSTRDTKAVRMLIISGISYFVAWGPYTIAVYLIAFKTIPFIPEPAEFIVAWLANSNSFMNVLIYSGSFEGFRKRLKRYFSCFAIKCCRQNSVEPVSLQADAVQPTTITQANVY